MNVPKAHNNSRVRALIAGYVSVHELCGTTGNDDTFGGTVELKTEVVAPSLSLIASRSMRVYLAHLESSPAAFAREVQALERLATPVANRKESTPIQ